MPDHAVASPEAKAAMLGPLSEQTPPLAPAAPSARNRPGAAAASNDTASIEVMLVALIITIELLAAVALLWLWVAKGSDLAWCGCGRLSRLDRPWRAGRSLCHPKSANTASGPSRSGKVPFCAV